MKIGFAGLGNMGGPMARKLLEAGHELKLFDLVDAAISAVDEGSAVASAADAARDVEIFISMLPAGKHVRSLYLDDGGVLDVVSAQTLLIDCSTIDPQSAKDVAAAAEQRGVEMLDAPVSGGTAGAEGGTLTFIVGGGEAALDRARPLLEIMGANIFHAGTNGAGQTAKVCNNMLLAIHMAGTAEALALGVASGLDPAVLSEIMKQSSGGNWSLNVYNPYPGVMTDVPASRDYQGGFLVDLMAKDLGLALQTARESDSSVPLGALADSLFALHKNTNAAGRLDFSSIQWLYQPDLKP
jgi:3-hydroxyisobutyrate dehydrogenase